jgi:hypothetical protein
VKAHLAGAQGLGAGDFWRMTMGVVQRFGSGYRAPGSLDAIDSLYRGAELRAVNSTVLCGDGDEPGSQYFVGYLPTNGSIDTGSLLMWGSTGVIGQLGFKDNPNAFGEHDMSAEGGAPVVDQSPEGLAEFGIGDVDKRFWQHAKLARDEGGELPLVLTIVGGASVKDEKIKVILKFFRQG